ncbi:hypothetical protein FS837_000608, partial [Tulasnella sp. UAMH 9824]
MATSLAEPYSIPDVPPALGEDGGKFWKYYDDVSDELDDDLVKRLKSQLDALLIFAGLFAGVNSGFLAMTLPLMKADPADDTNALLLQLVKGNDNTTQANTNLPSSSFSPTPAIYAVNVLFAISLTFAMASSFLAVLGQQWLVHYRKREGGGPEHERWEQLRRHLGAKRWKLELVLDDILPGLLQLGVAIFCTSFVIYLGTLKHTMWAFVAVPTLVLLVGLLFMATAAAWDKSAPPDYKSAFIQGAKDIFIYIGKIVRRPEDDASKLQFLALKRVICTSEDQRALDCAIANLRAVNDTSVLRLIRADDEMHDRLRVLANPPEAIYESASINPMVRKRIVSYTGGLLHTILLGGSIFDFLSSEEKSRLSNEDDEQISHRVYRYVFALYYRAIYLTQDNDIQFSSDKLIILLLDSLWEALSLGVSGDLSLWPLGAVEGYSKTLSLLKDDPSDKLTAIAACKLLAMNECFQLDGGDEQVRHWIKDSSTNLQNAYQTG